MLQPDSTLKATISWHGWCNQIMSALLESNTPMPHNIRTLHLIAQISPSILYVKIVVTMYIQVPLILLNKGPNT